LFSAGKVKYNKGMLHIFRKTQKNAKLAAVSRLYHGDWVNVVNPSEKEIAELVNKYGLPAEFVHAALDEKERSRIDAVKNWKLFIIRIPVKIDNELLIIPLGVIINECNIFTICAKPNEVINDFLTSETNGFYTSKRTRFLLFLIKKANKYFDKYVEELQRTTSRVEHRLLHSQANAEVISFLQIQKTITYFHSALINNGVLFEKITVNKKITFYPADKEILEDMIIENKELLETVTIFINNINSTMDAYASVISNNLNITMKFLTSLTIILNLPNIITSFYGMNVKLPLAQHPFAYLIILIFSLTLIFFVLYLFFKRRWL